MIVDRDFVIANFVFLMIASILAFALAYELLMALGLLVFFIWIIKFYEDKQS